jgi:hypothetical protein
VRDANSFILRGICGLRQRRWPPSETDADGWGALSHIGDCQELPSRENR